MKENKVKEKQLSPKKQLSVEDKILYLTKENKYLNNKIAGLTKSRDTWKLKCKNLKKLYKKPNIKISIASNSDLKLEEEKLSMFESKKAKNHTYSILLVAFCVNIQSYGAMSLRSCVHVLFCLQMSLCPDKKRIPCHNTVRNWVCKLGVYRVEQQESHGQSWVYWLDESIHIGSEKILLILGAMEKDLKFEANADANVVSKGLPLSKTRVLFMETAQQWTGDKISEVLKSLNEKFKLSYIVSDNGNNLKKSYKISGILHIPDCTHTLSNAIENIYENQELYQDFIKLTGLLRKKWCLMKYKKAYLPPYQRTKARFSNLFPLIKWAKKMLDSFEELTEDLKKELKFLSDNSDWINTFWRIQQKISDISSILKKENYTVNNDIKIREILDIAETPEEKLFLSAVDIYLKELSDKIGEKQYLYCCSDVIESAFGKLKQKLPKNSSSLTSFIFSLASIGGHYEIDETLNALETIKLKTIKEKEDLKKKIRNETETLKNNTKKEVKSKVKNDQKLEENKKKIPKNSTKKKIENDQKSEETKKKMSKKMPSEKNKKT